MPINIFVRSSCLHMTSPRPRHIFGYLLYIRRTCGKVAARRSETLGELGAVRVVDVHA